jgi:hypothetical protein
VLLSPLRSGVAVRLHDGARSFSARTVTLLVEPSVWTSLIQSLPALLRATGWSR